MNWRLVISDTYLRCTNTHTISIGS